MLSKTKTTSLAPLKPRAVSNPISLNAVLPASWSRSSINHLNNDRNNIDTVNGSSHWETSRSERRMSAGHPAPFIKRKFVWAGDISRRVPPSECSNDHFAPTSCLILVLLIYPINAHHRRALSAAQRKRPRIQRFSHHHMPAANGWSTLAILDDDGSPAAVS